MNERVLQAVHVLFDLRQGDHLASLGPWHFNNRVIISVDAVNLAAKTYNYNWDDALCEEDGSAALLHQQGRADEGQGDRRRNSPLN